MSINTREAYKKYISDNDGMNLPPDKTCGNCIHFIRCKNIYGRIAPDEVCDWAPSKFMEVRMLTKIQEHELKVKEIGSFFLSNSGRLAEVVEKLGMEYELNELLVSFKEILEAKTK